MTSEQRIAEWADKFVFRWHAVSSKRQTQELESAARTLIASVRAEAGEEFCKLFDGHYYGPFEHPSLTIRRALAKERKGEE